MTDFYSIAFGVFVFFGLAALAAIWTERRNDASDDDAEHVGIGGGGFFHEGGQ